MKMTFAWQCPECLREVTAKRNTMGLSMEEWLERTGLRCPACGHEVGGPEREDSFEWGKHAPKGAMRLR